MQNPIKTADEAYADEIARTDDLLRDLGLALISSIKKPDWSHVGNLNYVNTQLTELVRFVRSGESHDAKLEELQTENENLKARLQRLGHYQEEE